MGKTDLARVLTIAGSDSGGGAGIQADIKTCTALGVYAMTAVTSITAQNTRGVSAVYDLPPELVAKQIDAVADDIGIDAAKTGMLSNTRIIEAVADSVVAHAIPNLVVDPVMVASSGDPLLEESAQEALRVRLIPLAHVLTPNVPEAEALTGIRLAGVDDLREAARALHELGPRYVLMKGGHLDTPDATDYLFDGVRFTEFSLPRVNTTNTHGTGCTYAAAIAAYLAQGCDVPEAVRRAKEYLTKALQHSIPLGRGHGPVNHGWPLQE